MSVRPYKKRSGELVPGWWVIDIYPAGRKGRRQRITLRDLNEAQAREAEGEIRRQHISSTGSPAVNPTINQALPEYQAWQRLHRSPRTCRDFHYSLKRLLPHFGHLPVSHITETVIDKYKAGRAADPEERHHPKFQPGRPRTINRELLALRALISWMVKRRRANPLPFKIELLPHRAAIPRVPHPETIECFLAAFSDRRKRALVTLLYDCGLRWSEASNLHSGDVDLGQQTATLRGKGNRERYVILSERLTTALDELWPRDRNGGKTAGYFFANKKTGKPWGSIRRAWATAERLAKVKLNPHLLRHAYGTYLLEATGDLRLTQEGMGHSQIGATQIYTHISTSRLRQGMAAKNAYITSLQKSTEVPGNTADNETDV